MKARPLLLASYWTTAGNVVPRVGVQRSPVPIQDRVRAVAEAGFHGMGFMHADIVHEYRSDRLKSVKALLAELQLSIIEFEFLTDWFADGERREASDHIRSDLLEMAATMGAHHIKVTGDKDGYAWEQSRLEDDFGDLCRQAQRVGTRVALELTPWSKPPVNRTGRQAPKRDGGRTMPGCFWTSGIFQELERTFRSLESFDPRKFVRWTLMTRIRRFQARYGTTQSIIESFAAKASWI